PDEGAVAARVGEGDDDAGHLPAVVDERPARTAGIDGRVELDETGDVVGLVAGQLAVQAGDDATGGGGGQAERVADRHYVVADRRGAAEHRGHHRLGQLGRGE